MELECKNLYIFLLLQFLPCAFHRNNNALLKNSALKMRLKTGPKYTQ